MIAAKGPKMLQKQPAVEGNTAPANAPALNRYRFRRHPRPRPYWDLRRKPNILRRTKERGLAADSPIRW
jgi:hypothetical protein